MEYEYKVVGFKASVKARDIGSGKADTQASVQLAAVLEETARDGWELQGQYRFGVDVKPGCIAALLGNKVSQLDIEQLVFRRPK